MLTASSSFNTRNSCSKHKKGNNEIYEVVRWVKVLCDMNAAALDCLYSAVNHAACCQRTSLLAIRDKLERWGGSNRALRARMVLITKSLVQNTKCHFASRSRGNDRERKHSWMPDPPLSSLVHLPVEKHFTMREREIEVNYNKKSSISAVRVGNMCMGVLEATNSFKWVV